MGDIQPQFQSSLLRLPGELRNKIYEYTCFNPDTVCVIGFGANHHESDSVLPRRYSRVPGNNILREVCRQLRCETLELGWTLDPIAWDANASLPESQEHCMTIVYLESRISMQQAAVYPHGLQQGITYCKDNPKLRFILLPVEFRMRRGCRELLAYGAAFQRLLRNTKLPFYVDSSFEFEVSRLVRVLRAKVADGIFTELAPDNFRVFPIGNFDEDALRHLYMRNRKGFENWVVQIREWYYHGI